MRAFYGQDYHWRRQFRGLFLDVEAPSRDAGAILAALAGGRFSATKGRLHLPSNGQLPAPLRSRLAEAHERSQRLRGLVRQARGLASRFGMTVPSGFKAQLRRIL
jgi:hypothetical protein